MEKDYIHIYGLWVSYDTADDIVNISLFTNFSGIRE